MKRFVALGFVGAVLLSITGCGGPDVVMKELITHLNVYAETIEKKDPPERQRAAFDRGRTTLDKFLKLSREEQDRMVKKYDSELRKARDRFDAARKAQVLEGGTEPPDVLEGVFK
jgi:hypothetical protein